jgi:Acyltransferase
MKSLISFVTLMAIKIFPRIFYRFKIQWPTNGTIVWRNVRLVVFFNHTSLFEIVFLGIAPVSFLWMLSKHMVAPGADKTLNRPIIGRLFKLFSPGMTSITRKRDNTWDEFLDSIAEDSITVIAPEGRMKRKNGLDLEGKKMTVRPGVIDILQNLNSGQMLMIYSGGLHHIQVPGEGLPRLFKTVEANSEIFDIAAYKASFKEPIASPDWKKAVLNDFQNRLETKVPQ